MAEETEKVVPQKKGKGTLIIIILLVLILIGGGAAVFFLVIKKPAEQAATTTEQTAPQPSANAVTPGPIVSYGPFLVNLADPGGNKYLKISLALELSNDKNFPAEVTSKEARIRDIIITTLSAKTVDQISTTEGKNALKQELLRRLNTIMSGGRINDVFITEFVTQN